MTNYEGIEVEGFIFLGNDTDNEVSILNVSENYSMVAYIEDFGELSKAKCMAFIEDNFKEVY